MQRSGNAEGIELISQRLYERRIEFCKSLRDHTPEEMDRLRELYLRQMQRDTSAATGYRSVCWLCGTEVHESANDKCQCCGWLVCACGACLCPGYKGRHKSIYDCEHQMALLGDTRYEQLLLDCFASRSRGWGDYNGKVKPPGRTSQRPAARRAIDFDDSDLDAVDFD